VSHSCEIVKRNANPGSVAECAEKLRSYKLCDEDTIIIDQLSNSFFCGTDAVGNPADPVKLGGVWHLTGDLIVRPKSVLKATLSLCSTIVGKVSPRILIIGVD
jgi:hypothetical protein